MLFLQSIRKLLHYKYFSELAPVGSELREDVAMKLEIMFVLNVRSHSLFLRVQEILHISSLSTQEPMKQGLLSAKIAFRK